ncbi:hypothetical protein M8C21_010191 [Ambrosia artemisiifolia]|uniref:Nardilysin-like n=1 Tax=Ambrosia artemisiifolia TaxID=4212 RepID=A0AAD5G4G6_AMBAR|nr:hypothetical protein M8C21_010191 [Ambrosia artemisiifolia]
MAIGVCDYSSDDIVIKSPNDRRLYRYIRLSNGLCALLVHDPDIYADGPPDASVPDDVTDDDDDEGDDDEDEEDEEESGDEEDGDDEGEEREASKSNAPQTKKAAAAMCVGMGSFCDPLEAQGLAHFLEHMLFMGSAEFPDENEYDSYLSKHGGSSNAYTEVEHTCYHFEVKPEFLLGALKRFSQFFISPLVKTEAMDREVLAVDSGNKKSLVDAMENGINLRDHIFRLYNEFYHGGLLKLVVIGGESLDVLEGWVLELFSKVKTSNASKSEVKSGLPVWSAGKLYRVEAVKDVHILDLSWTLPCLRKSYMKKAEDYLAHLIGHEGRGSLLFFLKEKGWASSISAGVGDDGMQRSSVAYVFGMSIHLTDSGLEKIYEIIGFVYQYIKLLRQVGPQEWIYRELQDIANMDFTFAEEQPQDEYAAELSDVKYEPWFGSQYTEEDISPSLLELWRDPPEIDVALHLPAKNEFIPQDFSIRAHNMSFDSMGTSPPTCILDESLLKFWTKEQLGYVVDCSPRVTYRILGFCFRVQSSEYSPVYLQGRIDNFINEMNGLLSELDDESFQNYKSGLIAKLLEKDPSLSYETNRYWGQITDQRYMFDLSAKEAEEVKCLEKSEITNWYNTYLRKSSPKCRRLAVRVWGCNTNISESKTQPAAVQVIDDPVAFKASSTFYPAFC